jgi:hypothetical protein
MMIGERNHIDRMSNWRSKALSWLTRQYGRVWGGIVEKSEYSAYGVSRTVFWFDQNSRRVGDFSPFGTILMNRQLPEGIPEEFRDYVFLHEVGHGQVHPILRLLYLPCVLGAFLLAVASVSALPLNLLRAVQWATGPASLILFAGVSVTISAIAILPLVGLLWVDETYAEIHAVSYLGIDRYSGIRSQIRENRDPTLLRKIRYHLQYPPIWLVLKVARWRDIGLPESG